MSCPRSSLCNASVCPEHIGEGIYVEGDEICPNPRYAINKLIEQYPPFARLAKRLSLSDNKDTDLHSFIKAFNLENDANLCQAAELIRRLS